MKNNGKVNFVFILFVVGLFGLFYVINKSNTKKRQEEEANRVMIEQESERLSKQREAIDRKRMISEDSIRKVRHDQEMIAWKKAHPKAAKIYAKHPEWSIIDCENLADGKIWLGMHIDMLKYMRGLPNSANPSDYGYGVQWQWCWHDYRPSCFYDDDNDGLIDKYN